VGLWQLSGRRGWLHASDDALVVLALAGSEGSPQGLVTHVMACPRCGERLAGFEQTLAEGRRIEAVVADQACTQSRLDRQRASILQRIGGSRAAARILPFPVPGRAPATPRRHLVRRSVAAAAVAGLVVGAFAGRFFDSGARSLPASAALTAQRVVSPPAVQTVRAAALNEEAFLGEFEAAVVSPRVEPLLALDALTPRPADVWVVR
jgi:hypothetical protein